MAEAIYNRLASHKKVVPYEEKGADKSDKAEKVERSKFTYKRADKEISAVERKSVDEENSPTATAAPAPTAVSSSSSSSSSSAIVHTVFRDYADWKRKNGVPPEAKVFTMTGWYPCVKQALLDRFPFCWSIRLLYHHYHYYLGVGT